MNSALDYNTPDQYKCGTNVSKYSHLKGNRTLYWQCSWPASIYIKYDWSLRSSEAEIGRGLCSSADGVCKWDRTLHLSSICKSVFQGMPIRSPRRSLYCVLCVNLCFIYDGAMMSYLSHRCDRWKPSTSRMAAADLDSQVHLDRCHTLLSGIRHIRYQAPTYLLMVSR